MDGNWILNPTFQQLEFSALDLTVSGSADSIMMVEGGALEVSEADILEALKVAQKGLKELLGHQEKITAKAKRPKLEWVKGPSRMPRLAKKVKALAEEEFAKAINAKDKHARAANAEVLKQKVKDALVEEFPEAAKQISALLEDIEYR